MPAARKFLIWGAVAVILVLPIAAAAFSPLLAWRQPIYIAAGFAGIVALALMLLQPLLAAGYLPGLPAGSGRRVHRWAGVLLVLSVFVHVGGLWITSPPDVLDALLFVSPTPFSAWGVIAMWAIFGAATLAVMRKRLRVRIWRRLHTALVTCAVLGSAVHAMLIEGTMEIVTKTLLCILVPLATLKAIHDLRSWGGRARRDGG